MPVRSQKCHYNNTPFQQMQTCLEKVLYPVFPSRIRRTGADLRCRRCGVTSEKESASVHEYDFQCLSVDGAADSFVGKKF